MRLTFRLKLILWNLGVLSVSFISLALILSYANITRLQVDIDRDLSDRARHSPGMDAPPGPPPGGPRPPGFGPPPGPGQRQKAPEAPTSDIRRPRFFDQRGNPIGPPRFNQPFDYAALTEALRGEETFSTVEVDGSPLRVFSAPWIGDGERRGAVQVANELSDVDLLRSSQIWTILLLTPIALLFAGVGASFLASRVLRPISDLTNAAREITAGGLSARLAVEGEDELASLGRTFNDMARRLEASFGELRNAYSELETAFERQRRFTADASHELRTPLTRIKLATSSALGGPESEYRQAIETADRAASSMSQLIDQLLLLAKADAHTLVASNLEVDLRVPIADACAPYESISVELPDEPIRVVGEEGLLQRVVGNLVENAKRHSQTANPIEVALRRDGSWSVLTVRDHGKGIAAEHLPYLFDRFYRADLARSRDDGGSGLGLSICRSIVEALRGEIGVESHPGAGTTFTVRLPLAN